MLKGALSFGVLSHGLAAAVEFVFIRQQPFQSNGAAGVKLAVADSQFSAQAITEAVSKARGSVVKDAGGINFIHEQLCSALIRGKNAFGVA